MSEEKNERRFSLKSRMILTQIRKLIAKNPVTLEYVEEGKIFSNARTYDLLVRKDCEDLESMCKSALGYSLYISALTMIKSDDSTHLAGKHTFRLSDMNGKTYSEKLERMNPWLGLLFLIDEIVYQVEVGDLCDSLSRR